MHTPNSVPASSGSNNATDFGMFPSNHPQQNSFGMQGSLSSVPQPQMQMQFMPQQPSVPQVPMGPPPVPMQNMQTPHMPSMTPDMQTMMMMAMMAANGGGVGQGHMMNMQGQAAASLSSLRVTLEQEKDMIQALKEGEEKGRTFRQVLDDFASVSACDPRHHFHFTLFEHTY
jgi:hypothetical protein